MVPLALVAWLASTGLGFLLIDLDAGPKLTSLPSEHGLKLVDTAGVLLLMGAIAPLVVAGRWLRPNRVPAQEAASSGAAVGATVVSLLAVSMLVPDSTGRRLVLATLVVLFQAAAATVLSRQHWARNGYDTR